MGRFLGNALAANQAVNNHGNRSQANRSLQCRGHRGLADVRAVWVG